MTGKLSQLSERSVVRNRCRRELSRSAVSVKRQWAAVAWLECRNVQTLLLERQKVSLRRCILVWQPRPSSGAVSDYYEAVRNAMVTAPVLAREINALPGPADTKTLFAHSLGCGVISSAIADHVMIVGRVCFVDAALARECFDGRSASTFTPENDGVTPSVWKAYDSKLYAANWFNLLIQKRTPA